jgi:hypothetical protein
MVHNVFNLVTEVPTGKLPLGSKSRQTRRRDDDVVNHKNRSLRYIYCPPLSDMDRVDEGKLPKPPFECAPSYMRSVYYYWWAFLRENDEYIECCDKNGQGPCIGLYRDFGDIRSLDFWAWWSTVGYQLFHERDEMVALADPNSLDLDPKQEILVKVPLSLDIDTSLDQIRLLILENRAKIPVK